jgi:hypothetical protein
MKVGSTRDPLLEEYAAGGKAFTRCGETVFDPPCRIRRVVDFISGRCPFSNEEDCRDCISNDFDDVCIRCLINADFYGMA